MGLHSEMMIEREQRREQAIEALVAADAVKRCDGHEETYMDNYDPEAEKRAYSIGANWVEEGRVSIDHDDLMEAITEAYEEAADECPSCQKNLRD